MLTKRNEIKCEREGKKQLAAAARRRRIDAFFTIKQLQITGALISEAFSTWPK